MPSNGVRLAVAAMLFMLACTEEKYPDYFEVGDGIYYTIHQVGHGESTPQTHDHLILFLEYRDKQGNLIYTSSSNDNKTVDVTIGSSDKPVSLEHALFKLREGDSATIVLNAELFFKEYLHQSLPGNLNRNDDIFIDLRLCQLIDVNDYKAYQDSLESSSDPEIVEFQLLNEYLANIDTTGLQHQDGIYYKEVQAGKGSSPSSGKQVALNYIGYFISGQQFDATTPEEPAIFKIGKKEHLLPGMEIGVRLMRPGGRAKIIIPSHLAYGSAGSSSGIVPPYTTLIYEVELIDVID